MRTIFKAIIVPAIMLLFSFISVGNAAASEKGTESEHSKIIYEGDILYESFPGIMVPPDGLRIDVQYEKDTDVRSPSYNSKNWRTGRRSYEFLEMLNVIMLNRKIRVIYLGNSYYFRFAEDKAPDLGIKQAIDENGHKRHDVTICKELLDDLANSRNFSFPEPIVVTNDPNDKRLEPYRKIAHGRPLNRRIQVWPGIGRTGDRDDAYAYRKMAQGTVDGKTDEEIEQLEQATTMGQIGQGVIEVYDVPFFAVEPNEEYAFLHITGFCPRQSLVGSYPPENYYLHCHDGLWRFISDKRSSWYDYYRLYEIQAKYNGTKRHVNYDGWGASDHNEIVAKHKNRYVFLQLSTGFGVSVSSNYAGAAGTLYIHNGGAMKCAFLASDWRPSKEIQSGK